MPDAAIKAGTTTAQMREAPRHAVFVWPFGRSLSYATDLAQHLGRADLNVVAAYRLPRLWIDNVPAVVIDHACRLSAQEQEAVARLEAPARRMRGMVEKEARERLAREGQPLESEGGATSAPPNMET